MKFKIALVYPDHQRTFEAETAKEVQEVSEAYIREHGTPREWHLYRPGDEWG